MDMDFSPESTVSDVCFVCNKKSTFEEFSPTSTFRQNNLKLSRNAFHVLGHILELDESDHILNSQKFRSVQYCEECLSRVRKIQNLLEQLDNLEQQVIQEKNILEQQFKTATLRRNYGVDDVQDHSNRFQEFRENVVDQLESNLIRSTLSKIKAKTIGQRRPSGSKQFKDSRVQIMKDVQIKNIDNIHQFPLDEEFQDGYSNQTLREISISDGFTGSGPSDSLNPNSQESVENITTFRPTPTMVQCSPSNIIPLSNSSSNFIDMEDVKSEDMDIHYETDPLEIPGSETSMGKPKKKWKCRKCDKEFNHRAGRLAHERTAPEHRTPYSKMFICDCGFESVWRQSFMRHGKICPDFKKTHNPSQKRGLVEIVLVSMS